MSKKRIYSFLCSITSTKTKFILGRNVSVEKEKSLLKNVSVEKVSVEKAFSNRGFFNRDLKGFILERSIGSLLKKPLLENVSVEKALFFNRDFSFSTETFSNGGFFNRDPSSSMNPFKSLLKKPLLEIAFSTETFSTETFFNRDFSFSTKTFRPSINSLLPGSIFSGVKTQAVKRSSCF